jgi:glycosyltransferase involved in cell wall biosynthesis
MTRVLISTVRLLEFLEGAGHFWAYMQYAHALRRLGCEVLLLDSYIWSSEPPDEQRVREFLDRMARYGFDDEAIVANGAGLPGSDLSEVLDDVDLLLNFNYHLGDDVVSAARRSALVDIDPGLLQFWISRGFIAPAEHDLYFTTGETIPNGSGAIPDCGLDWLQSRPPVCLDLWPYTYAPASDAFTTVSSWWGERDYVGDPEDYYDNTKRTAFFDFMDLPRYTDQPLELALFLADSDEGDRKLLEDHGWRVRHSPEVASSPEDYRAYVQSSRGEFSWAKASCMRFQNAWVSDRSLCYLASGKPVVVQDTGPSSILPDGEGMFRFKTMADVAQAFETINGDYERQCRLARRLAEEQFDAEVVVAGILERAL